VSIYDDQGRYADGQFPAEQVLKILETKWGPTDLSVANALNNLAWNFYKQKKYDQARPLSEKAIRLVEQRGGTSPDTLASHLDTLANIQCGLGEYAEAERNFKRAVELFKSTPDQPDVAISIRGLAKVYRDQARHEDAEVLFKRAMQIQEQKLGADSPELAETLEEYALLLRKTHRDAEAARLEAQTEGIKRRNAQSKLSR
jgi:tetratricopeptide (TPR) repeat protein